MIKVLQFAILPNLFALMCIWWNIAINSANLLSHNKCWHFISVLILNGAWMDKLVVRSLSDEIIDAQAHWPAAPRLVISERPRLINLPLTTIHLNWVFISWPGLSPQLPVEQDDAGQDGEDAEGGDRGDREDNGEVDDDHQGADH